MHVILTWQAQFYDFEVSLYKLLVQNFRTRHRTMNNGNFALQLIGSYTYVIQK